VQAFFGQIPATAQPRLTEALESMLSFYEERGQEGDADPEVAQGADRRRGSKERRTARVNRVWPQSRSSDRVSGKFFSSGTERMKKMTFS
jgi:hypothetical protein